VWLPIFGRISTFSFSPHLAADEGVGHKYMAL
jgi:hypothetical protein